MNLKLSNLVLMLVSTILSLLLAEAAFRLLLFNEALEVKHQRNPSLYADSLSEDDFFKLHYLFPGGYSVEQVRPPHPQLGWVGTLDPETLTHPDAALVEGRRPVLLYGDSFASCVNQSVLCFEDILNQDEQFTQNHFLLNYGVPGYGTDQITLLLEHSAGLYEDPLVIYSFMITDLDRNILTFRGKPKPYFLIEEGELTLAGVPITQTRPEFLDENPLQINSYLYRRILYSGRFPDRLRNTLTNEAAQIAQKQALGEAILLRAINELETRQLDYFILVFYPHIPQANVLLTSDDNWRDRLVAETLNEQQIPFISAKEIFFNAPDNIPPSIEDYIITGDGHPTTYYNQLISRVIKDEVHETAER